MSIRFYKPLENKGNAITDKHMKKNSFLFWWSLTFLTVVLQSCSIEKIITRTTIQKEIKVKPEISKDELYFENDYAILYFDKEITSRLLKKEINKKKTSECNKIRLKKYIDIIDRSNGKLLVFQELTQPSKTTTHFETDLQRRLIEKLVLKNDFVLFNKKSNKYEKSLIYRKNGGDWGCCFAELAFKNGENFLDIRIWSDFLIIEDCNEQPPTQPQQQ